jgi:phosphonate transport system substrate-binding protein
MSLLRQRPARSTRWSNACTILALTALLLLTTAPPCDSAPQSDDTIVFAPTLFDSTPDEIRSQLGPARFIEMLTGRPVVVETHARYEPIIRGFAEGRIDLAILGPLPYVSLHRIDADAVPLVRFREADGRDHYRCSLVAFADDVRPLAQYRGARLALTQPFSTCGYFGATTLLEQAGVDIESTRMRFLGPHDQVGIQVASGQFDIGVLKDDVARRFASLGVVTLAKSQPLPGFSLIANAATLDAATRERIRAGFLAIQADDHARLSSWPRHLRQGATPAADADYQHISADFARIEAQLRAVIAREKAGSP